MSGGSGNFMHDLFSATPTVQGSVTPIAQPGTTPAWQTAANPQQMQPNPNPYLNTFGPANMPPPVTNMGPGVNAAFNWSPQQQQPAPQAPQSGIGGLAQPTQQPSYQVVQAYQQPQPQTPAFGGGYTQKYYNRS
jgi:hypothetical protein